MGWRNEWAGASKYDFLQRLVQEAGFNKCRVAISKVIKKE